MDALSLIKDGIKKSPIYTLFFGVGMYFFAPENLKWVGLVSLMMFFAGIADFLYNYVKNIYASNKNLKLAIQKKEEDKIKKEKELEKKNETAVKYYNKLNSGPKRIIDSCIANGEYVYKSDGNYEKSNIQTLVMFGFGTSGDFDREIYFNKTNFFIIEKLLGEDIKSNYFSEDY